MGRVRLTIEKTHYTMMPAKRDGSASEGVHPVTQQTDP